MKTADKLYEKYKDRLLSVHICGNAFSEALTEHDNEIKQLIDEMIKALKEHLIREEKRLETESPDDVPDISYFEDKGKYNVLIELKSRI